MLTAHKFILIMVFSLLVMVGSAKAETSILDLGRLSAFNPGGYNVIGVSATDYYKQAQSFSLNYTSLRINRIDIRLKKLSGTTMPTLNIFIENNTGNHPDTTTNGNPIPGCVWSITATGDLSWGWRNSTNSTNCLLQKDRMYWIVINTTGVVPGGGGNPQYNSEKSGDNYANGNFMDWYSGDSTWNAVMSTDLALRVWTYDGFEILSNYTLSDTLETKNNIWNISLFQNNSFLSNNGVSVQLYANGTYYTPSLTISGNYYNFSVNNIPPYLQGEINYTNIMYWWNISVGGSNVSTNLSYIMPAQINGSQGLNRIRMLPCAAPMQNWTVNFSVFDAIDLKTPIISNLNGLFFVWVDSGNRNYSYSLSGNYNYSFCIFPGWVSYKMNTTLVYTNASYATGNYITQSQQFSNTTQNINLYLLNLNNATSVLFTVYNNIKVPQANVVIIAQKLDQATSTYTTVASGQTGYDGTVSLYLQLGQYYQFVIQINGITLAIIPAFQVNTNSYPLYITGNYVAMFNYINSISASCTPSNVTYHLTCSFNDLSGLMSYISLKVTTNSLINTSITLCSLNSTASSGSFDCNLAPYNQSIMTYAMTGTFQTSPVSYTTLADGIINWAGNQPLMALGGTGIFLALILVVTLFFAGMMNSPATAMILGCVGLIMSQIIGLINIGWFDLIPVILTAVIIVYKLED